MFFFDKFLAILHGAHRFPQPKTSQHGAAADDYSNNLRAEDGFVPASRRFLRIFSILAGIVILSSTGIAQTGGKIAGSVKDVSGAVIPVGNVVLLNPLGPGTERTEESGPSLQIPNKSSPTSLRQKRSTKAVGYPSPTEVLMAAFRTVRPLLVDATQAEQSTTVSTRTGVYTVAKGDWIVTGENGETYFVDNPFFQRTFVRLATDPWQQEMNEGCHYGC
jgi:hypothetical protein